MREVRFRVWYPAIKKMDCEPEDSGRESELLEETA